mmetsp:Transcript_28226/g.32258  ORF Transcript_28226/g.32258 Transcript_28226/m.32258 type:complete len:218 (+) Transcript_28226:66-719(+)
MAYRCSIVAYLQTSVLVSEFTSQSKANPCGVLESKRICSSVMLDNSSSKVGCLGQPVGATDGIIDGINDELSSSSSSYFSFFPFLTDFLLSLSFISFLLSFLCFLPCVLFLLAFFDFFPFLPPTPSYDFLDFLDIGPLLSSSSSSSSSPLTTGIGRSLSSSSPPTVWSSLMLPSTSKLVPIAVLDLAEIPTGKPIASTKRMNGRLSCIIITSNYLSD